MAGVGNSSTTKTTPSSTQKNTSTKSRWDLSRWTPGPVSILQAIGINWNVQYPALQAELPAQVGAAQPASSGGSGKSDTSSGGSGASTGATPAPGGSSSSSGTGKNTAPQANNLALSRLGTYPAVNGCSSATNTANAAIVNQAAAPYGWSTGSQWDALNKLVMSESGYCNVASNPSSAYGIGQFLDSTWATVGGSKTSDPHLQARFMMLYIKARYGNPIAAWQFHLAHNWY